MLNSEIIPHKLNPGKFLCIFGPILFRSLGFETTIKTIYKIILYLFNTIFIKLRTNAINFFFYISCING